MQEFEQVHIPKPSLTYKEVYEEIKEIGMGAFGKAVLVRVRNQEVNTFYIAKHIMMDKVSEKDRLAVKLEADILKELNSEFVTKYINSY